MDNREYQLTAMIDDRNNWRGMYNQILQEKQAVQEENHALADRIRWMEDSRSWKITKPLRKLKDIKGELL